MKKRLFPYLLLIGFTVSTAFGQIPSRIFETYEYVWLGDTILQDGRMARALSATELESYYLPEVRRWTLTEETSAFPQYTSESLLETALYNLALEELTQLQQTDGTLRMEKSRNEIKTRDIGYSTLLALAYLQPEAVKKSLLQRVNDRGRIMQDIGTGGSWPVSTDRMIWAAAAWEVYVATGDKEWLRKVYPILRDSAEDDLQTLYDPETGLVRGESSFLDWREQEYPLWMQCADIHSSQCLGTNAVHYRALEVLAEMAQQLGDTKEAERYRTSASRLSRAINQWLWLPERNYYGQFLYGRNYRMLSPRSETLGEALCILFDIADNEKKDLLSEYVPTTPFGTPCFFPYLRQIPPYHNNAVWPFVEAYWMLASAKAKNEAGVMHSIASIYRGAAMALTNKENFVATSGDFAGTQMNSDQSLGSVAGNLAIVHRLLFGIRFTPNELQFEPFVPEALKGKRTLTNFRYRNALLTIELNGHGTRIKNITLDGGKLKKASIPGHLSGHHRIVIELADNRLPIRPINMVENAFSLETPELTFANGTISWKEIPGAHFYTIYRNGTPYETLLSNFIGFIPEQTGDYQVVADNMEGLQSFASSPLSLLPEGVLQSYEVEKFAPQSSFAARNFQGEGFVETDQGLNETITIPIEIEKRGKYAISWVYANGNGPVTSGDRCAIRTLTVDGSPAGTSVFPQRGENDWSRWGLSNIVQVTLTPGPHTIGLQLLPCNQNMNGTTNRALIDQLRITRLD